MPQTAQTPTAASLLEGLRALQQGGLYDPAWRGAFREWAQGQPPLAAATLAVEAAALGPEALDEVQAALAGG